MHGLQRKLTGEERRERQRVYLRDTAALGTLLALAVALSFVTYLLFHSFTQHRLMLQARWRARGEAALAGGHPLIAIDELHSALAYAPDDRGLQVELATALAAAGRTQEAQVYFTTLLEAEPGSGVINLQMARLAARTGNVQTAVDHYQASIDGTWLGDAFTRRREIRLELARYLIAQHRDAEAREILLITSGNGPDNYPLQVQVGSLLEQAGSPADALDVYKKAAGRRATRLEGLEGEGRAAAALGRFAQARKILAQASGEPGFAKQPQGVREGAKAGLNTAEEALALFPGENLPNAERAHRIAHIAALAQARLLSCPAPAVANQPAASPTAARTNTLAALADHLKVLNPLAPKAAPPASAAAAAPADPLAGLAARTSMPTGATLEAQLASDPVFAQNTLELAYQTERATAGVCGAPTGEDALLLRIAQAPDQVEAQS